MPESKVVLLRETFISEAEERAYAYEDNFRGCCQTILLTFQELLGMEDELTFKAAGFLSAGVAICQKTCGALLGGEMVLGMNYGRSRLEEGPAPLFEKLEYAQKLVSSFESKFGSTECREISGIDFSDRKVFDEWRTGPGHEKCCQVIGKTAKMVAEILCEIRESDP